MKQHYVVINDTLCPDTTAPLVLEQKLKGMEAEPVTGWAHAKSAEELEMPETIKKLDLHSYGLSDSFILKMAGKMIKINDTGETDLKISIYPGNPGTVFIDDSV